MFAERYVDAALKLWFVSFSHDQHIHRETHGPFPKRSGARRTRPGREIPAAAGTAIAPRAERSEVKEEEEGDEA
jgi:hypothetical protein